MKITKIKECPSDLRFFDKDDLESKLQPKDVEDIIEIFHTPLTGSYNWDYTTCLLYTSPSPRDVEESRMPSSA